MASSQDPLPSDFMAEAQRRAEVLRQSGELPDDIDDRLADDYSRAVRRDTDRSPLDPRPAIDSLRNNPDIAASGVVIKISGSSRARAARATHLLQRSRRRIPTRFRSDSRHELSSVLEMMVAETERVGRLADDAVATADMLADRVTQLERELAVVLETRSTTDRSDDTQT